ncbi:hypothetical protein RB11424 [Rhodopirellula baltica SH 1]|uniref:Uncharacterized protein n=1 Tax=Rhodopirellula baltica (strain DSM 10527 / NCIMB 13988 / SH1) TaxID=243090 RepID=Q7UEC4_RHOBA|nr:hypothetical protein RB11424 [Rhodopirellula baltica SH 1]
MSHVAGFDQPIRRGRYAKRRRRESNSYVLHSGSRIVCLATASETSRTKWDRFDTQWFCVVESNRKNTRRSVGQRPVSLSRKLAGRGSNPLDLSVVPCTPNRQPSVFRCVVICGSSDAKNAIDEVVTRGFYGALPLSYGAAISRMAVAPVGLEPTTPGS